MTATQIQTSSSSLLLNRGFALAFISNLVWINISEVFRYFVFVMPMMREAFSVISDVAPMNIPTFMIWGIWDTILVFSATIIPWMFMQVFGGTLKNAVLAGTLVWFSVFVILWLGMFNMNLAVPNIMAIALPLAWFEMVVAALIVWWFTFRNETTTS